VPGERLGNGQSLSAAWVAVAADASPSPERGSKLFSHSTFEPAKK
jgi:hypothetical protein